MGRKPKQGPHTESVSRRRRHLQEKTHAEFGRWTYRVDDAGNAQYVGSFPEGEHALGAVRHFVKERWIDSQNYQPERDGDTYFIRLESKRGDNLKGFEDWWTVTRGNALPERRRAELRENEHRRMMHEMAQADRLALAFQPAPHGVTHAAIGQLTWEGLEFGHIVAIPPTPQVAFQVALYLRDKKYIGETDFWRMNEEIKHAGKDTEFRIVIPPEQVERFENEFPGAGEHKSGFSKELLDRITTLSLRNDSPNHRR